MWIVDKQVTRISAGASCSYAAAGFDPSSFASPTLPPEPEPTEGPSPIPIPAESRAVLVSSWVVDEAGKVFTRLFDATDLARRLKTGGEWKEVAGASVSAIAVSENTFVYAIESSTGKLIFRSGVSRTAPAGTSWETIDVPANAGKVISVAVGLPPHTVPLYYGKRSLWVSTENNKLLYRVGVTSKTPAGTDVCSCFYCHPPPSLSPHFSPLFSCNTQIYFNPIQCNQFNAIQNKTVGGGRSAGREH